MGQVHSALLVAVIALVTMLIRFLPPLLFDKSKKASGFITYLGEVLPYAIMGMLVIYCLKDVSVFEAPYGLPELAGIAVVIALHLWKRNTLLSIIGATVFYMALVQHL